MKKCLFCDLKKEENYFKSIVGGKPNVVCIKCTKNNSKKSIVDKIVMKNANGCLLWPEADRGADYYNETRRNLYGDPKSELKYLHVNCNEACLNNEHIFRFKTNSTPYWFRLGLRQKIDFDNITLVETDALKKYILNQSTVNSDECWLFGTQKKKNPVRFDEHSIDSKKLSYEIFNGRITDNGFSIIRKCGTINCVNPAHLQLVRNSGKSFWSRNLLKKPDIGFWYCENTSCDEFGTQISLDLIKAIRGTKLCGKCFDLKSATSKKSKAEYDLKYCEQNSDKIKTRIKAWSKTESGKSSQIASSHKRRRKGSGSFDKEIINILKKNKTCCYCDRPEDKVSPRQNEKSLFEIEHITPICGKGQSGDHNNENLEYACWECNSSKKNNRVFDWIEKLKKRVLVADKNENRKALYQLIIVNLSKPNNFVDGKFIARHMRIKTVE